MIVWVVACVSDRACEDEIASGDLISMFMMVYSIQDVVNSIFYIAPCMYSVSTPYVAVVAYSVLRNVCSA